MHFRRIGGGDQCSGAAGPATGDAPAVSEPVRGLRPERLGEACCQPDAFSATR